MSFSVGSHKLGPENAKLLVRTKKGGAASKAGHNLLIEVTAWSGTLAVGDDPSKTRIELSADARSMKVLEGTGGVKALSDDDKASIKQTIDDEVLRGRAIEFHSTSVASADGGERLKVDGVLELAGTRAPVTFELTAPDGHLAGTATVKQSNWAIKPYSALFGTLKVLDEVTVEVSAELPSTN
jgi:polyisoprenoid-binding protein YceI